MMAVDERRRRQIPDSGFGLLGTELFANRPIADMLHEKTSSRVMQASAHALAAEPFSQLQVRRRLTEAATFDAPIVLDDVIRVTKVSRVSAARFRAAIPFTGDPDLFQAKGHGSARRKLKATIDGNSLVITATSFACDVAMVPYAIASEVIAIREMLAEQQDFILKHNRQAGKAWRAFVDERWDALCTMRTFAVRSVQDRVERDRRDILLAYDVIFGKNGSGVDLDEFILNT